MLYGKVTTVNLREEQKEFLKNRSEHFNFSAFVRDRLDEYMKLVLEREKIKIDGERDKLVGAYGEVQCVGEDEEIKIHVVDKDNLKELANG